MRNGLLILFCVIVFRGVAQNNVHFDKEGDTVWLKKIQLKSTLALHLNGAIVLMEQEPVLKKLKETRKAVKKQYQKELRNIGRAINNIVVVPLYITHYEDRLRFLDTHIGQLENKSTDTVVFFQQLFESQQLSVSELVPPLLEAGKCMVMDSSLRLVPHVIRKTTGQSSGLLVGGEPGSSYYFLPHATEFFLQKVELSARRR